MSCVRVRNVFKSHKNGEREEKVLDGINMSVNTGTIYTLIGASGCGKTTLLSCLMGIQKPQSGELSVFGRKSTDIPGLIGYMPQQNSLVAELTIGETLCYFSRLYEMDEDEFEESFAMISKLLELPRRSQQIRDLSGGQQRRVSLAATIIHNPRLLILDEPTVGLDFLLRERIWNFLVEKTKSEGLTTIITTHYISEAANANFCGFMRNGKLIAEDSPREILGRLGVESLDDAFYELCTKAGGGGGENFAENCAIEDECEVKVEVGEEDSRVIRPRVMQGLLVKEFHRMRRQPLEIFLILVLPIVQVFLFLTCIGVIPSDLRLAVVNQESGQCSDYSINYTIARDECAGGHYSCEFIDHINSNTLEATIYDSSKDAWRDFRKSNVFGIVDFSANFSQVIFNEENDTERANDEVTVNLDYSKYPFVFFAKAKVVTAFFDFLDALAERCQINELLRARPIRVESLFGNLNFDLRHSLLTAIVISTPFTMCNVFALLIVSDTRIAGVWNRTLICGVRLAEIILANVIECLLIALVLATSMIISIRFYGLEIVGSEGILFVIMLEIAIVGFMLGFLISILFDKFQVSSGIGQLILVISTFTTGILWPVESLSPWLRPLSYTHPLTFPIIATRNVILKGVGICHPSVILGLALLNLWIIALAVLSYFGLVTRKFSKM